MLLWANNPFVQAAGQAPAGLDQSLASVRFDEDEQPQQRGRKKKEAPPKDFKAVLWVSADKLRAQLDVAEYKHLILELIFLKYFSYTFVESSRGCWRRSATQSPTTTWEMTRQITKNGGNLIC